jgi:type I restriction enzyme S subunit
MRKGWEIKKLGDVCDTGAGGTPLKAHKDYYENGDIPWLLSGEVSQGEIYNSRNYITKKGLKNSSAKLFPINTVLVAMYGATAGQVGILKFQACTNQAVCGILPNEKFIPKYIYYCFLSKKKELIAQAVGGAQPNISQIKIKNTKIPVISISEQQEIVSILDDAFESIERAKSNAEQNLKNARELFDSYLQNIFEKGKWEETTLEKLSKKKDAIVSGPFGSNLKVSDYKEKGVPILRLQNVGKGKFINKSIKFITKEKADELKYHSYKSGDIVLAKLGIPIGKTCIIPDSFDDGIITADVVRIRPDKNFVNYKFLEYFLNTNISVAQLTGNISGATRPRVNLSDVRNIKLVLPKLDEQLLIVNELDILTIKINKLEEILDQKINCLEELKKSILQKAFNGELKTSKISA